MTSHRILLAVLVLALLGVGCGDDRAAAPLASVVEEPTTTTVAPEPDVVTNGWVQVGYQTFDLAFTCYAPGPGDVVAIGVGGHPDSGQHIEALIREPEGLCAVVARDVAEARAVPAPDSVDACHMCGEERPEGALPPVLGKLVFLVVF